MAANNNNNNINNNNNTPTKRNLNNSADQNNSFLQPSKKGIMKKTRNSIFSAAPTTSSATSGATSTATSGTTSTATTSAAASGAFSKVRSPAPMVFLDLSNLSTVSSSQIKAGNNASCKSSLDDIHMQSLNSTRFSQDLNTPTQYFEVGMLDCSNVLHSTKIEKDEEEEQETQNFLDTTFQDQPTIANLQNFASDFSFGSSIDTTLLKARQQHPEDDGDSQASLFSNLKLDATSPKAIATRPATPSADPVSSSSAETPKDESFTVEVRKKANFARLRGNVLVEIPTCINSEINAFIDSKKAFEDFTSEYIRIKISQPSHISKKFSAGLKRQYQEMLKQIEERIKVLE